MDIYIYTVYIYNGYIYIYIYMYMYCDFQESSPAIPGVCRHVSYMPDMWVHPHYNHFSLPACRCVGPRLGVVRRWRVPKRVDSCCQGCGRCFLRGSHRSGWVQSRLWRSWYSLGIWIQVDHNISLSWWFERPYCSLVRNLLEVRGALPIHIGSGAKSSSGTPATGWPAILWHKNFSECRPLHRSFCVPGKEPIQPRSLR